MHPIIKRIRYINNGGGDVKKRGWFGRWGGRGASCPSLEFCVVGNMG